MSTKLLLICLFLLTSFLLFSCKEKPRVNNISSIKTDSAHIQHEDTAYILNTLKRVQTFRNPIYYDSIRKTGFDMLKKSNQINYTRGIAKSYNTIQLYYALCFIWDSAIYYGEKAIKNYESLHDTFLLARKQRLISMHYSLESRIDEAIEAANNSRYFFECLGDTPEIYTCTYYQYYYQNQLQHIEKKDSFLNDMAALVELSGNKKLEADFNNVQAGYYIDNTNMKHAMDLYFKNIKLCEEIGDTDQLARTYGGIANVHYLLKDYKAALEYYSLQEKIYLSLKEIIRLGGAYNHIGQCYIALEETGKARQYLRKSLNIRRMINYDLETAETLHNLALCYYKTEDSLDLALNYLAESLVLNHGIKNNEGIAKDLILIGRLHYLKKDYDTAIQMARSGLNIAEKYNLPAIILDGTDLLGSLYAELGWYQKAYRYQTRNRKLNDSLIAGDNLKKIAQLEMQRTFDEKQKETELKHLQESLLMEAELHRNKLAKNFSILIGILFVLLGVYIYRNFKRSRRLEIEKAQELDHMKSRFFANISHEFRTPLTLLQGPVEDLLKSKSEWDEKERGLFKLMQRNIKQLQMLINQLLDLSKLETGNIKLQVSEGNLSEFIRRIVLSFLSLAESKHIDYRNNIPDLSEPIYFDPDKVEKILTNIISNAFKFTSANGKVSVRLKYETTVKTGIPEFANLCVSDTGKGIPEKNLDKIFDRFYQVSDSNTRDAEGTGIGLALTKELIDLYRGEIHVESKVGKGSKFSVKLPVSKKQFKEEEIVTIASDEELSKPQEISWEPELAEMEERQYADKIKELPVVLIVEDNIDLKNYISGSLCDSYQIITAENGKKGLELAIESIPDLVVSDLMMPVMDGIEMCKHLKTDERTNHIPLVILTTRADRESKIEGLETGADDYIVKPFDAEELQIRIKNLIKQRNRLREKFRKEFFTPDKIDISLTKNEQLIKKLFELFEENYSDFDFSIEDMSIKLNMSRTQFFRKVDAFIGESPNELLRLYRMKKAAALIQSGENNITSIMYDVGFRSTSHFANSFKKYFGQNPSEYRNSLRRS